MDLRSIGGEPVVLLDTFEVDEAQGPTGPHPSGFATGAKVARVARFASVDVVDAATLDAAGTPQPAPSVTEVPDENPQPSADTTGGATQSPPADTPGSDSAPA